MASNEDLLFVELALKKELVSQEQVDEILALRAKLEAMGLDESISDLMVKKGVLADTDAAALKAKVSPKGGRQQIEGYRLIERIGRGGMGSVYKGVQLSMNRPVALKVLSPALTKDEKQVARLRREAQLVGKLQHPNIVQGVDHGVSGGFHYFAMEYVDGESVREVIASHGLFREKEALRVVTEVAEALAHAHGEGIVHRDIKPGNILMARDGTVKLADYGLAKGPLEDIELTQSGVTVGTPQYISPEQARGPSEVDIRTDIYSLGATLYHMLTGRPPYEGETLAHLIQQVLYEPYAPPQTLRRNLSKDTAYLIEKMMARHPRHRYQNPGELLQDLKRIEAGKSIVPSGWQGDIETFYLRRRLRRWAVAAAIVVIVGVSATLYTTYRNRLAEQKKLEEAAGQAFAGLSEIEVTPENLNLVIPRLEAIAEDYGGTEGGEQARSRLQTLLRKKGPLDRALGVREVSRKKSAEGEYRAALEALRAALESAGGEHGDLARKVLDEARVQVTAERNRHVEKGLEEKIGSLLETAPEEARDELSSYLFKTRQKAFLDDESTDLLTEGDELVSTLGEVLSRVGLYLDAPRERLRRGEEGRNYQEIEHLRAEKEAEARRDVTIQNLLSALPGTFWSKSILGQFEVLSNDILEQNRIEAQNAVSKATDLASANRFEAGEAQLREIEDRSLAPVADTLLTEIQGLSNERENREAGILDAWLEKRELLILHLALRQWPAAHLKLDEVRAQADRLDPSPLREELDGYLQLLVRLETLEQDFLQAIRGADRVPEGLTVRAPRGGRFLEPEVLEVRVEGNEIFFKRKPGGEEQKIRPADVSVADLKRLAGERVPRGDPLRPMLYALLDLGEIRERSPQEREIALRTLKSDVERVARDLSDMRRIGKDVAMVFEEEIRRAKTELVLQEQKALERFQEGEKDVKWERWQEAYDAFNQLLTDRRFKNTKFVKDREQEISDLRAMALRNLSSVRLGEYLRGRVRHVAGSPVGKGGETVVAVDWVLDSAEELERFEYTKGRIGIVDQKSLFVGPPGRDWAEDEVRTVEDHHLRFRPPEKRPEDWLNRHPLKIRSPLMYSRESSIEFRARWERPLALVVSLCGTNLLVLSSTSRPENGRGVCIWQGTSLGSPEEIERVTPEELRASYLASHPERLKGEAAHRRYFRFEPDRWYKVRFVRGEMFAYFFVGDELVYEQQIKKYAPHTDEILLLTYSPMRLDDLSLQGTVDGEWYRREVGRAQVR